MKKSLKKNELKQIKLKLKNIKHEELIKSYNELIQKQKEGEDVTNSLYETILKLAEAYKVVNSELLSSSEYDNFLNTL